jgi:hypothetical protein
LRASLGLPTDRPTVTDRPTDRPTDQLLRSDKIVDGEAVVHWERPDAHALLIC